MVKDHAQRFNLFYMTIFCNILFELTITGKFWKKKWSLALKSYINLKYICEPEKYLKIYC